MVLFVLGSLFHLDRLSIIMMALVSFIGLCVGSFAFRYMKGDGQYRAFFVRLILLIGSVMMLVSADHLALLLVSWCVSNGLLVRLMVHKPGWKAARASGWLATKNFAWGAACIAAAFGLIYLTTAETSIQALLRRSSLSPSMELALGLLALGAITQSAIWPFHRWLISSLNSPTPVSAIMHAGLINGGGFLLVRFAPLYMQSSFLLALLTVLGFLTAWLGTFWKLMQPDVKRMLACSTMGQMGFMVVQCGLGLFPAAVAHLVGHGLFKAYLFLSSGSAAQEKRIDQAYPPGFPAFSGALLCGLIGSAGFALASGKAWLPGDTTLVLNVVALLSGTQLALPLLQVRPLRALPGSILCTALAGLAYGGSVRLITGFMAPMGLMHPQPLTSLPIAGILILTVSWLSMLFFRQSVKTWSIPVWAMKGYVLALNASQPAPTTITTHRNHYHYH